MSSKGKKIAAERAEARSACAKCHQSNLTRMVHLLRREDQGKTDTKAHLMAEFPELSEAWANHQLGMMTSLRQMYGGQLQANAAPVPVWVAWLERHKAIRRVPGGWMIGGSK